MMPLAAPLIPPFMANAYLVLAILAFVGGVVGVHLNLRGREFLGDGLVHAVFPGVVIGFVTAGSDGTYLGAGIAAIIATLLLGAAARRGLGDDAATAVVLSASFSLGVIIVSTTRQYTGGLEHFLFGQLLTVDSHDLVIVTGLCAVALLLIVSTWRQQTFLSFDRAGARAAGLRVGALELALNFGIALVIVAGARAIGNLLILALLIIPPAVGRLLTRRIWLMSLLTVAASLIPSLAGLWSAYTLSVEHDVNVSPTGVVALALTLVYLLAALTRTLTDRMLGLRGGHGQHASTSAQIRTQDAETRTGTGVKA